MELNTKQQDALALAIERYNNKEQYTYIAGAAGTGKSSLVQFIIAALHLIPDTDVCYVAYTGKAALNLQRKNCPNACTLHSLLYNARQNKETGLYYFTPKSVGTYHYKIIVVDEISMVPADMWDLLLQHGIHIIALGDIAQLPAIGATNDIVDKPHIVLTEIMRQEVDSEIIQIATLAREHQPIPYMKGNQVQVIHPEEYIEAMLDWSDMTLCATNRLRNELNKTARERLWGSRDLPPLKGDKIVCLHNEWNLMTQAGDTLVNGLVGYISSVPVIKDMPPLYKKFCNKQLYLDFVPDYQPYSPATTFRNLLSDYKIFTEGEPTVNQKNFKNIPKVLKPYQFDYAYALTCHKAQGSEYDKVLVFWENYPSGDMMYKWLYTAITRAVKRLVIVDCRGGIKL
jgi:exodeoxyribonuclease-5